MDNKATQHHNHSGYPLWPLALATALLPLLTIHSTYLISAFEGHIPWCLPHWDSCTSISSTGRHGTAYFIFKGSMIPVSVLMMFWWWLSREWLKGMGLDTRSMKALPWTGLVAALSMLLYTLALGHSGDGFHLMRRIGVVFAFALTYLGQLLISANLLKTQWHSWGKYLLMLSAFTLGIGIFTIILDLVLTDFWDSVEDAFEWNIALLVNGHALILALLWQRSGFRFSLHQEGLQSKAPDHASHESD